MDVFTGVGVALVTLLDESERVDTASTAALAADLADRGMRGVLVCGTTGEAATLSDGERTELIGAVRGALPGHIPVIAGTGAATTGRAAVLTAAAAGAGRRRRAGLAAFRFRGPERLLRGSGRRRGRPARARLPHPVGLRSRHPGQCPARPADLRPEGFLRRPGPAAGRGRALSGVDLRGLVGPARARRAGRRHRRDPGAGERRARALRAGLRRGRGSPAPAHRRAPRRSRGRGAGAQADPGRTAPHRRAEQDNLTSECRDDWVTGRQRP